MPIPSAIVRAGRTIYRDAKGRFVTKEKFELEQRRGPGGRFLSKSAAEHQRGVEQFLRAQLGAPPAGKQWAQIAGKYPDRFEDFLEGLTV